MAELQTTVETRDQSRRRAHIRGLRTVGLVAAVVALAIAVGCREPMDSPQAEDATTGEPTILLTEPRSEVSQRGPVRRHALLVGCAAYPNLDPSFRLRGPPNDVLLMRDTLISRFGFDPAADDMITLADALEAKYQPTRTNIEREFRRLGQTVQAGEPVVILLGGHGSQQPDNDPQNPQDLEPDGRDEIFLPSDVGQWNGALGSVKNAIVDDDLREWLGAIVDRGAMVWVIMDACHSGSGVRGGPAEISRHVPAEQLMPEEVLDAKATAVTTRGFGGSVAVTDDGFDLESPATESPATESLATESLAMKVDQPEADLETPASFPQAASVQGGLVSIYAAQPHETTPERRLPMNAEPGDRKYYGLLTFSVCEILSQASRPLTYRELVQAIQNRYLAMGRRTPTPLVEGVLRENLVLRQETTTGRSGVTLQRSGDRWKVDAGSLQGVTSNSIFAVYAPVGTAADRDHGPIGHVQVVRAELTSSQVRPCEYETSLATERLPERGRCELVYQDMGDLRLKVSVDPLAGTGKRLEPSIRERMLADLESESSPIVTVVDEATDAEWLARWQDGRVRLVPATGVARGDVRGHETAIPERRLEAGWAEQALEQLGKVARAKNLLRIAATESQSSDQQPLGLMLNIYREGEGRPLSSRSGEEVLHDGDGVRVELANIGNRSLDVTLLYIDSGYGIACVYPQPLDSNRLASGDKISFELDINANSTGLETFVAIAVPGAGSQTDFQFLQQSALQADQTRGGETDSLESPLGKLCRAALYGEETTRGISRRASKEYQLQTLSWRIAP